MTTKKTPAPSSSASSGKKDVQKLQRAVVDGLEDVKAQEIQVFDTEALSSLFERVVVASGTSNRQTKALASSVVDAVRKAGFPKPRVEGEGNGEWIIVDCGQVVVHVMQPIFRSYYRLEELWGEKPVRLKLGAEKPGLVKAEVVDAAPKSEAKSKASAKVVLTPSLRRSSAAKAGVAEAFPSKAALKKAAAKKAPAPKTPAKKAPAAKARAAPAAPARSAKVPTMVVNAPVKKVARKAVPKAAPKSQAKAAPARKALAVKAPVRKPAATKTTPRKA